MFEKDPWLSRVLALLAYLNVPAGRSHDELRVWRTKAGISAFAFTQLLAYLDNRKFAFSRGERGEKLNGKTGKAREMTRRNHLVRWFARVQVVGSALPSSPTEDRSSVGSFESQAGS